MRNHIQNLNFPETHNEHKQPIFKCTQSEKNNNIRNENQSAFSDRSFNVKQFVYCDDLQKARCDDKNKNEKKK